MCTCEGILRIGEYELDDVPVLPRGSCGVCRGRGSARLRGPGTGWWYGSGMGDRVGLTAPHAGACPACGGTGVRGEVLSEEHILVNADLQARPYAEPREHFEAAHRRHTCGP